MSAIRCVGLGPHAPADGILGAVPDGQPVPRATCAACAAAMPLPDPGPTDTVPDLAALAQVVAEQGARLEAAEAALSNLGES